MKKPSLQDIILRKTLPNPKQNDPTTFFGHVQRNLVPEVRHEVQVFYGSLDCLEAQYPGLDYTYDPHRRRLARYPWHRRLFRTFDELRLTSHEILSLCQWEGTRSAKERYEAQTKRKIVDTTADDVVPAAPSGGPKARFFDWNDTMGESLAESFIPSQSTDLEAEAEQSEDDGAVPSVGVQINQQLRDAVEAGSRDEEVMVDAQWEQWMKEALERNELDRDSILQVIREGRSLQAAPSAENGHDDLGRSRNGSGPVLPTAEHMRPVDTDSPADQLHMTRYDDLRSMLSDLQSANNQLAADNAQLAMLLSRSQPETAR